MEHCLNCQKSEEQVPLLHLRFQDTDKYICSQCFPLLIHKPEKLLDVLPGMQPGQPAEH